MKLNAALVTDALADTSHRPIAHTHLRTFLAEGGSPDLCLSTAAGFISLLLAAGADIHAGNGKAMLAALSNGNRDVVRTLLRHGASALSGWGNGTPDEKEAAIAVLDAVASDIPADQRQALLASAPHRFPALRALLAAERRQSTTMRGPPHSRPQKP